MSPIGGEKGAVQNPLIKYATEINWTYITPEDALTLRGGETSWSIGCGFPRSVI